MDIIIKRCNLAKRAILLYLLLINFQNNDALCQSSSHNAISFSIKIAPISSNYNAENFHKLSKTAANTHKDDSVATIKHSQILTAATVMNAWDNVFDILHRYEISSTILITLIWKLLYLFNKYSFNSNVLNLSNVKLATLICGYNFSNKSNNLRETSGETFLTIAVKKNLISVVKLLLERGSDVNMANESGESPLSIALKNGNIQLVKLLKLYNAKK